MNYSVKPYQRAAVFSGGGTRLVFYCGMYAAMVDNGIKPDLILATCGASLAAAIIQTFPDPSDIKDYISSSEFISFVMNTTLSEQTRFEKLPLYCFKSSLNSKQAPVLLDIFNRYLIQMPQDLSIVLPTLQTKDANAVPCIVVGSKINSAEHQVKEKREGKKVFQEVWMPCDFVNQTALDKCAQSYVFFDTQSAVMDKVAVVSNTSALQRARISMSDMFYIAPALYKEDRYLGGAINLIPIELALELADEVWVERKQAYKKMEQALVDAVFGYDASKRIDQINKHNAHFLDTRNIRESLTAQYVKRVVDWKSFKIGLQKPDSEQACVNAVQAQFEYGYQVVLNSL